MGSVTGAGGGGERLVSMSACQHEETAYPFVAPSAERGCNDIACLVLPFIPPNAELLRAARRNRLG